MKKNSGLIVLIIAGIVFLLAIKFDLMPGVRSFNSSSEVKQSDRVLSGRLLLPPCRQRRTLPRLPTRRSAHALELDFRLVR